MSGYGGWGVNAGAGWSDQDASNLIKYFGDYGNLLGGLFQGGIQDYQNSGAMADMLMGGRGFGQSRRYRQYNPYDQQYGYLTRPAETGVGIGGNPGSGNGNPNTPTKPPANPIEKPPPGWSGDPNPPGPQPDPPPGQYMTQSAPGPGGDSSLAPNQTRPARPLGPGQQDHGGADVGGAGEGDGWYDDPLVGQGPDTGNQQFWGQHDDAPVEGQGLLGEVDTLGRENETDRNLRGALNWQAGGDLSDLEQQEKWNWMNFGKQNQNEAAVDNTANWFRGGELSDLEQQSKHGWQNFGKATDLENEVGNAWRGAGGPGEYDPLRGKTLTEMVGSKGYSPTERSAMMGTSLLPIQNALESQKLQQDDMQARTGNAAGRWGASNALALGAAGQASQAGRDIEMGSANMARQDRAQGLEGLGGLQGQIDARKIQSASGLQNLSGQQRQAQQASVQGVNDIARDQRQNQLAGMGTLMQSNQQQRGAQQAANEGFGGVSQRQRQNQQWGLGALDQFNQGQRQNEYAGYGARKDMYDTLKQQGTADRDFAGKIGSLVRGGNSNVDASSVNAGVSV